LETRLTALTALKLLPAGAAARVARIEGRDGDPAPERWHILVHEPAAPHGLREYVVADGAVVADREISQFAETLSAADVIGASAVQIDSDKAARELQQLASKNSVPVHAINYALQKGAAGKAPVWNVSAVDEKGETARDGRPLRSRRRDCLARRILTRSETGQQQRAYCPCVIRRKKIPAKRRRERAARIRV
jgi:hypothetical protein